MGTGEKKFISGIGAILAFLSSQYSLACSLPEKGYIKLEDKELRIAVQLPDNIIVGHPFELDIRSCEGNQPFKGEVTASAIMPAHNHGMNYRPSFVMEKLGHYKGSGFLFHMFGLWKIQLHLKSDGNKYAFEHDVSL